MQHNQASHIHKAMYIQTLDPGAVGAKVMWLDTTSGVVWKKRNDANDGWDLLADVGALVTFLAAFDIKASVRAATTANITLSGAQTIDGVSVIAGERVLVKNQSTGSENGIYVCASGAWARATDADISAEVTAGMLVPVTEGSTQADTFWLLTTNDPITLGSTALTFVQFGAGTANIAPLVIENANTIHQKNGSNAQTFKIFADATNGLQFSNPGGSWSIASNNVITIDSSGRVYTFGTSAFLAAVDLGSTSTPFNNVVATQSNIAGPVNILNSFAGTGPSLQSTGTNGILQIAGFSGGLDGGQGIRLAQHIHIRRSASGATLEIKDGSDSGYTGIRAQSLQSNAVTVANLPASPVEGMLVAVTDSNTAIWGATIAGGGSNHVLAYYNGTNWTVAAK